MKRRRRIRFWFSLAMLAILVLAITWLWTADLGVFKPQVERFVSEKTGREFSIEGDFIVDFNRHPTIIAEDVRFGNPEWADEPHMVTVGRAEIRIDFWSLISGPFIIEFVDIDDVSVQLLNPAEREPNWVLATDPPPPIEEAEPGIDFLIEELYVDNVGLILDSVERTRPLSFRLNSLRQRNRDDGMLELDVDATLNGKVVAVAGELGTWNSLLAGKDVRFDIDAVLDTFQFTGSGHIDDLVSPRQPELSFTAVGPDIDDLTRLLGLGDEGDGNIDLSGSIQRTADEALQIKANGNIGETEIESLGTVSDLQSLDNIDFDLTASGPDLGRVLRIFGIHQVRESPFMVRLDAKTEGNALIIDEGTMVFADAQVDIQGRMPNFPSIDDASLKLLIEGPDIARFRYVTGLPGAAEGAFRLGFTIDVADDGFEVVQLDIETALGEVRGRSKLGHPPDFFASTFELRVRSESLERTASAYGVEGLPDYPFEIRGVGEYVEGAIRTQGPLVATVGDVSATVDGFLTFERGVVGSETVFTLKGPSLAELVGAFADVDDVPGQPFDLKGTLQVREDGYRFRQVQGNVGTSTISVDGLLTTRAGLAGTQFTFTAEGPAFEEAMAATEVAVRDGPYELSGKIKLEPDRIEFDDIELDRQTGHISLDLDLGLPVSERRLKYDVRARGPDVRALLVKIGPFQFKEQPVSIVTKGEMNGSYLEFGEFNFEIGDATMVTQGEIDFAEGAGTSKLSWNGNIPSLGRLATFEGLELRDQPVSLTADLSGGRGELRVDNLLARLGESDVNGKIYFKAGDVPELSVDVSSDSIVIVPLLEEPEFKYDPEPEFEDGRLIPDIAVPFDELRKLNASFEVDIKALERDALYMRDIEFDMTLQDGVLEVPVAAFKARSGALLARGRLEPTEESGAAMVELIARQFALGMSEMNLDLAMTGDIDINLRSTGKDLRTLLGNANGEFFMNARGGRVTNIRAIQRLYGDLLQEIFSTVNPFRESDPYTDFNCIVVPLKFDDGIVSSAPNGLVSTSKVLMSGTASVNLESEELQLTVRTMPQRTLSISAGELLNPYVQVVGTLAAPRLAVDERGLLITGGAAVATGGLSILARGVWDRMSRAKDPCKEASDKAIEQLSDRFPDLAIEGLGRIE